MADVIHFLAAHAVVALMLAIGLETNVADVAQISRHPKVYLRSLLVMELGVPLFALLAVVVFQLDDQLGGLILLMAVCPGAPFVARASKRKGMEHSEIGLDLFLLASLLAPLTVPIWLVVLDRVTPLHTGISIGGVLQVLVPKLLLPLVIGLAIRHFAPRAADILGRIAHYFFLVALAIAIVAAIKLGAPAFADITPTAVLVVLLLIAGSVLMGYWAGSPEPGARGATGVAAALGNPGLVLAIAAVSYPGFKATALLAAYIVVRALALLPYRIWIRHHEPVPA